MQATAVETPRRILRPSAERYAKCIEASKRIRWDIDRDVIRGRRFDFTRKFMPDGLSQVNELTFLTPPERRFLSQIQGRTYANMFGLVERFIGAKTLELVARPRDSATRWRSRHWCASTDEELKHQELFRRLERMAAEQMPPATTSGREPNVVADLRARQGHLGRARR